MLAYLYCAAYTRMTMYELSPPFVNIGALHLTMICRECSWLDPSYQSHITFACTGCYQLHPHSPSKHYYPRLIAGTNLPTTKGGIAWLAKTDWTHIILCQMLLHNWIQRHQIEPRLLGPRPTQYQWTNRAVHYRPRIISETARSAVEVEPTTFRTAATDDGKD